MASERVLASVLGDLVKAVYAEDQRRITDVALAAQELLDEHNSLTLAEEQRMNDLVRANRLLEQHGLQPAVSFRYEGHAIIDPTCDESMGITVDPVKYYGERFIYSDFTGRKE